ncbi:hypothetical protein K1719_045304 [Acacia pycnantha]|nr:hypothetical protein K1719_045304 [Acacia pycnantha]
MASPSPSSRPNSNPSPSSSKEERRIDDVFLTYLTKCETTVSLQTALNDASISTFIDHNKETSPTLLEAIELSRIVIIVFTKHSGLSRYFLDKLHIIINCHKNMGKKVLPVFCGVSLLGVRQEMGSIAELTSRGDLQKQEFFRWRNAYTEATSLPFRRISTKCSR